MCMRKRVYVCTWCEVVFPDCAELPLQLCCQSTRAVAELRLTSCMAIRYHSSRCTCLGSLLRSLRNAVFLPSILPSVHFLYGRKNASAVKHAICKKILKKISRPLPTKIYGQIWAPPTEFDCELGFPWLPKGDCPGNPGKCGVPCTACILRCVRRTGQTTKRKATAPKQRHPSRHMA